MDIPYYNKTKMDCKGLRGRLFYAKMTSNMRGKDSDRFMKKEQLLLTKLIQYGKTDMYPMHMPGHKRETEHSVLKDFPNPFTIDITEIEGFDNLHHPEDILKASMEWAAQVYGADHTYYLVNGSSCGILSAVCGATVSGGRILISRNCHKSVYHGVILNQLKVNYVYPQIIPELGIQGGISRESVEKALEEWQDVQAVLIVSPTYDGVVSKIREIAEAVHERGIPLIVDEAHGAHFSFGEDRGTGRDFPKSALECGADVVIQSLHKTLPSLTQTAVLHVKGERVNRHKLERYLQMFQSSSPSYVFMAGIEQCIFEMAEHGRENLRAFSARLELLRSELRSMRNLKLLDHVEGRWNVYDLDRSKIVVSCRNCLIKNEDGSVEAMDGNRLSSWLRDVFHLEMEMCGSDYVVAILTCLDTEEGLKRLLQALMEIDAALVSASLSDRAQEPVWEWELPRVRMKMAQAMEQDAVNMRLEECAGKVSAEFIYLYPPGIPIVAPGEEVTETIIEKVLTYRRMGLPVQGMEDPNAEYLMVLRGI